MNFPGIYIGSDPREIDAFMVARYSIRRNLIAPIPIYGLILSDLQERGLYTRPTKIRVNGDGRPEMIDELSIREDYDGRISTQHAIARFLVPMIHRAGLALFVDGDILVRGRVEDLFWQASKEKSKAVWCVKHDYRPEGAVKMDGQQQAQYARKNWSSVMMFDCGHPANAALTLDMVNKLPGRDLHRLCWLDDSEIGEFDPSWNWLVGHSSDEINPNLVHFTTGTPSMPGYENVPYADEWRGTLNDYVRGSLSFGG